MNQTAAGRWARYCAGVVIVVVVVVIAQRQASVKAALGRVWSADQHVSIDEIDHAALDRLLKKYVDKDGYVDYRTWYSSQEDRQVLRDYLSQLSRANPSDESSHEARLAFWINAYNAVTLEGIMQVYPTSSIQDHTATLFGYNIWKDLPLIVGSSRYSLEHIENQILRRMHEPRIHFAIVCASISCPRLRNEAYTAVRLDEQLSDNATDFFARPQNLHVSGNTLYVSSILDWFKEDFGNSQSQRMTYLKPFLPKLARPIATRSGALVVYLDYNWNLNDQSKEATIKKARTE